MKKTVLIILDGMRSDGLVKADPPFLKKLMRISRYTFDARSIMPTITLPVITSILLGVRPEVHGVYTNDFTVREEAENGLFELIHDRGLASSIYYNWEQIGRIHRPNTAGKTMYVSGEVMGLDRSRRELLDAALKQYENDDYDFTMQYFVNIDEVGHQHGWMSDEYIDEIRVAFDDVEKIFTALGDRYNIIVSTDHGGHDRCHGTDMDEDMVIPMFIYSDRAKPEVMDYPVCDIDIAPTIADLMGLEIPPHWQGKSLLG